MDHETREMTLGGAHAPLVPEVLMAQALRENDAAVTLIHRLVDGDTHLLHAVARADDATAAAVRHVLLRYLAHGLWQGHLLPLPPGFHAGRETHRIRRRINESISAGHAAWQRTLLDGLAEGDGSVRQISVSLLGGCQSAEALDALATLLAVHDEGMRWAAAMALIASGRAGARATLRRMVTREVVPEMRHVAAYVLRYVPDEALRHTLAPVVRALDDSSYRIAAPPAAETALAELERPRAGH
ncbi:MAG TPA: HEAT repeat domain-containing protein [Ktedonobacterales bacterium]|jgi:hypothetical protein